MLVASRARIDDLAALLEGRLASEDTAPEVRALGTLADALVEDRRLPELSPGERARIRQRVLAGIAPRWWGLEVVARAGRRLHGRGVVGARATGRSVVAVTAAMAFAATAVASEGAAL